MESYDGEWIENTTQDRINRARPASRIIHYFSLNVHYRTSVSSPVIVWTSLNPSVATINQSGVLTYVSDGTCTVRAEIQGTSLQDEITLSITSELSGIATEFLNFASGSLAAHCEDAVNSRIAGATAANLSIFSTQNHTTQTYVRNLNCWIYNLGDKVTGISPWNSTGGNTRAGTLITPRHIIFAAHYEISEGATVRFVTVDNQVVNRTMVKRKRHPSYTPYYPDLTIGVLDSDVPNTIIPCKVLPSNYSDYLPTGPLYIAALCLDQEEKALVTDLGSFSNSASFMLPNLPYEQVLYESKIVGDSGNPAFLIINGELVILTVWTFGGAGGGTFITPQIAAINQMISDVDTLAGNGGTGYTLTTVDLSGFPTYA